MKSDILVSFDGHDGVGKSTVIKSLKKMLEEIGLKVCIISGAPPVLLSLKGKIERIQENQYLFLMYYLMLNFHTYLKSITRLQKNDIILIDRYIYSTIVLFKSKNIDIPKEIQQLFPLLSLSYWVVVDEETRKKRIYERNTEISKHDLSSIDPEIIEKANSIYNQLSLKVLDNSSSPEVTANQVYQDIVLLLGEQSR